jgi:hypothetical protein
MKLTPRQRARELKRVFDDFIQMEMLRQKETSENPDVEAVLPFWVFDCMMSVAGCGENHKKLNGGIAPLSWPGWAKYAPPLGPRCCCCLIGITRTRALARIQSGECFDLTKSVPSGAGPDPGYVKPRLRKRNPAMKRWLKEVSMRGFVFALLVALPCAAQQPVVALTPAASKAVTAAAPVLTPAEVKAAKRAQKDAEKSRRNFEKRMAKINRFEAEHPSPLPLAPPYPGSLSPNFQQLARQAAAGVDNAFNTMVSSRMEFALANQNAMLFVSVMRGGAASLGEQQVAQAISEYAESVRGCQQILSDVADNLLLAFGNPIRHCQDRARFLRSVADLTMRQNQALH